MSLLESIVAMAIVFGVIVTMTTALMTYFARSYQTKIYSNAHRLVTKTLLDARQTSFTLASGTTSEREQTVEDVTFKVVIENQEVTGRDDALFRQLTVTASWNDRRGDHQVHRKLQVVRAKNS